MILSPKRIAILGTRGIPNHYGGFEQFAEYLAQGLWARGHEVAVYLPHTHPFTDDTWREIRLIRVYNPEYLIGAAANFIYDYLSLRDAVRRGYEVILECGYQSAAISYLLVPLRGSRIITNMDGLEWSRAKWSPLVRRLTRWFESLGVRNSHALVSDNPGIQEYIFQTYGVNSHYIPYGAEIVEEPDPTLLCSFAVKPGEYYLLIARLEPENNIEMILEGYTASGNPHPFLLVGNTDTTYGRYLLNRFKRFPSIRFLGKQYHKPTLDTLRHFVRFYFHGHSVGGTNPSLLEAMGSGALIAAHDNTFNRAVLGANALFFKSFEDVRSIIQANHEAHREQFRQANYARVLSEFAWPLVINQYERLFQNICP